jgi:SAM-dependent methyltransferase
LIFRTRHSVAAHDVGMSTATPETPAPAPPHDWHEAGEAWGRRANDWACLMEHYSLDVLFAIYARIGLEPGTGLLDIACGSGLGARLAGSMGANVSGIDAAAELLAIARQRSPAADLRLGSMFELPWADESFDAAVSINGIWGGGEHALHEAFRVLRPGALIGISFWGLGPPLDLRPCFKVYARHSPEAHVGGMRRLNNIAMPGVAEEMFESAGFAVCERDQRISVVEWPDAEVAWRALSSIGPAVPALRHGDLDEIKRDILTALEPCRDERGVYRFRNDHHFVIARKP